MFDDYKLKKKRYRKITDRIIIEFSKAILFIVIYKRKNEFCCFDNFKQSLLNQ